MSNVRPQMDQQALYRTLREAHCTVLMFEDHPQFFGNWRAHFKRGDDSYEVVCDNREGWLTLWKGKPSASVERLREIQIPRNGEPDVLSMLHSWLQELGKGRT